MKRNDLKAPRTAGLSTAGSHHRTDIQGLRALAVAAVVLAHAGVSWLGGGFVGVDLFFVLSGFLITELLIREWQRHGRVSLPNFWARRVRRLLPASALVLVVTAIASAFLLPAAQRRPVSVDIVWSALFAANWRFADQGTDYFAADRAVSPVQHFWSLAVEEQFYVIWPFLAVACGVAGASLVRRVAPQRDPGEGIRWVFGAVAAVVVVASCLYSIRLTGDNQPLAYFGTFSRAWQLAVGALLASGVPLVRRLPGIVRHLLAVTGLAAFAWAVLSLEETGGSSSYPGTAALVPTLGAGALVAAGTGGSHLLGPVLALRPLQWLGDLSYSLYLWHFPVLIIGAAYLDPAGWTVRSALVAVAVVAAWASYVWLETPLRSLPRLARSARTSIALGLALVVGSSAVAVGAPRVAPSETKVLNADGEEVDLGRVLVDPLFDLRDDPRAPGCTAVAFDDTTNDECLRGDPHGDKRVVLLGDSHAGSIVHALDPAAQRAGWRLNIWSKPACPIPDVPYYDAGRRTRNTPCEEWKAAVFERAVAADPDVVVLTSSMNDAKEVIDPSTGERLDARTSRPRIIAGYRKSIEYFTSRDIPVVVIQDWPKAPQQIPDCLLKTKDARKCAFGRSSIPRPEPQALKGLDGVRLLRIDDAFCGKRTCSPLPGRTLVYRDNNHLTRTYANSLAPLIQREIYDRY
ncbi:acyltransferase family protein [Janibacter indicus]|uniref:Peptidoglycan/LPS O-acetylase OafA/YrhL, contains acyltransferase and SGNH-hydrolase domains n=1 Tax=Janibacter indicus TaxID=857417 RepID=A0A1W2A1V6_9MICO|nr:acyltransferase family protein [Janibacter indicus]SMC54677.1 Peptidoglycan/LPS O-acetylase OafA/YrhL, contains acyltransferase and SGNH-hydrolase domains [Janibacter indicus]